jgi:hypothetical protein
VIDLVASKTLVEKLLNENDWIIENARVLAPLKEKACI